MFCTKCGQQLEEGTTICPNCGQNLEIVQTENVSIGLKIICLLFPFVGLIVYIVKKDTEPINAKICGKMAIYGVILDGCLSVISWGLF
jgi:hypothetical protein